MKLYHGSTDIIEKPVIRQTVGGRDFGPGFYCTDIRDQAEKWALRQGRIRKQNAVLNIYEFNADKAQQDINIKMFNDYSTEWLELVINCRRDIHFTHEYDIVYGKIANDDIGETVQTVIDGLLPMELDLQKLAFMSANNQYCFCTLKSLVCLEFIKSEKPE